MPQCPLHQGEELEPKRKGWFCEECGAIVFGYESFARPGDKPAAPLIKTKPAPDKPYRPKAHSLPCSAVEGTPTHPIPKTQPDLLSREDTTRWALAPAAARSARETLRSLASAGLPASIHVERSGIDDVLPLCFARPRRALLVVGPPGVGKTALLARIAERAIGAEPTPVEGGVEDADGAVSVDKDARDVVVFLSGRSAYEVDTAKTKSARLCDAIVRCADVQVGEFDSLEDFVAQVAKTGGRDPKPQRKMWLILDGIDEARAYDELIEVLDKFLPQVESHGWIRLVVSMRRSTYDALAARGAEHTFGPCGAFASERWWTWFRDDATGRDVPFLALRRFDEGDEVRKAYQTRQEAMAHRASKVPYDELPPALRGLLRTPLHLHLFHDAFRGDKAPPGGLDEPALVDAFLDSLVEEAPGLDRTLLRLGKALLRRHRPDLPLDLAEQWKSEWSSQRADPHAKSPSKSALDPITELVTASGLMAPDEVGHGPERGQVAWRFSHERLGEQILLRDLLASISPRTVPTGDEIVAWAKTAAGTPREGSFSALVGALEILVARLVSKGEVSFAKSLLDIEDQPTRTRLLDAVLLGLGEVWDDDVDIPPAAKTLDALVHASMLRDRGKRFLSAAWRPLLELIGRGSSPAARALHRSMFEVARATYGTRDNEEGRLPYATTLEALGQAAYRHGDDEDARRYFEEAVRHLTDAAGRKGASDSVRGILAAAHRRIARIERDRQENRRARKSLETALRVASHTDDESQTLPPGQHQELLLSLLAMGDQLYAMGSLREAEQAYEEALRASLAALVESPHRSDLRDSRAAALAGLAEVATATDRPEAARERFGNTLRVLRKLTRREPQRWDYHLELVQALQRLATLLRLTAEDHDACQLYEESAAIMLALVHAYPRNSSWRSDLVGTLANLGVLMRQIGEDEPARACLEDAVRHGRELRDDSAARRSLASALTSLVQLDEVEGRRFEAHKHVDEALALLRSLSRDPHSTTERRCLALALIAQGRLASDDGDADASSAYLNEAVRVLSELVAGAPDDMSMQADLGAAINGLRYLGGGGRVRRIPKHTFSTMVTERGGTEIREFFDREEISIGRAPGNDLMLPNYSVSRHHATVAFEDGAFTIEDLGSKHGTTVGGKRVNGPVTFRAGEKVELGDFVLVFEGPVDTSYGAQWSSMMASAPTGFPPPVEEDDARVKEASLEALTSAAEDELPFEAHDIVELDE
jgi:tetratricopeptide (TPR) repeat protein